MCCRTVHGESIRPIRYLDRLTGEDVTIPISANQFSMSCIDICIFWDSCAVIRRTCVIIFVVFLIHIEHAGDVVQLFDLMVAIRPRRGDKIPACKSPVR